jgi:hypothetical protein
VSGPFQRRSLGEVLAAISRDLLLLMGQLASLAKAELGVVVGVIRNSVLVATVGVALLLCGALTLVTALVLIAVALGLPPWAAALVVGVVLTLAGGVAIQIGVASVRRVPLEFTETRAAVTEGVEWMKTLQR